MYIPVTMMAVLAFVSAPDAPQAPLYKVEFTVNNDATGKPQPSQRYSMLVDGSRKAVFQAVSGADDGCGASQFIDTGAKIELTLHSSEGTVAVEGSIDLTSVTGHVNVGSLCEPIVGDRKIAFQTTVEMGKPATIDDDPRAGAMRRVQAVVTKVN